MFFYSHCETIEGSAGYLAHEFLVIVRKKLFFPILSPDFTKCG